PFELDDGPHVVHGSVGIAEVDEHDEHRHSAVFRDAELAMYQAKRVGGNSIEIFARDMHERARARVELAAQLRDALESGGLHLAYQPIVDLVDGRVVGYEALLRWQHPVRGPMSPAEFIPIAEQSGLIVDIGEWVLRTATKQLAEWQGTWQDQRYVSVNVAASQLATRALVGQVRRALGESGLAPERLLLEVTESSLIDDIDGSVEQMQAVRALGVRFALDDFGTGYSSLSYLRRFPVDIVKVDKSFIDEIHEPDGTLLVRAIINMAASLRLSVVAEGIEAIDQAASLQQFGCHLGQGYHFSRPMPVDDVAANQRTFALPVGPTLRVVGE
ncbi:MAG: GGDEF domain-containing protein, partial [Solirubrobacteraceae bacterium]|nr:GGDEF domain-containing protein [Solirubrobacteraceae bacterium]